MKSADVRLLYYLYLKVFCLKRKLLLPTFLLAIARAFLLFKGKVQRLMKSLTLFFIKVILVVFQDMVIIAFGIQRSLCRASHSTRSMLKRRIGS
jgi:hypothetical protein